MRKSALLFVLFSLMLAVAQQPPAGAQPPQMPSGTTRQPLSPRGQADFAFANGKKITVDYGRPYMRGRKIMGGLVPYGQVWRTGANAATGFVTEADLDFAGAQIPAGKYTLYTIPGDLFWTVIISKQTGQWGLTYHEAQDLARVQVKAIHLAQPVDQFTISFQQRGPTAGKMTLNWENTSVPINFNEK